MKNFVSENRRYLAVAIGSMAVMASSAHADLPAAATTALTEIETGITDASDAAWPLIGAALAAGILIKLVKRFANKI
ncbi:major coat protein [Oceanobacter sp. 3_MG-2023]|uniref:major coat protein n=1 Tax=Oceanobacter sp. 3_MG-2023 TaxID=3062622 RepID=UPI0027372F8E|nr:major coat protein [Oceanobacter sp. 3_MG-2023]MDP2506715.1 hypothetical protein [Oceanobacter sp. 3_MG-2023]